MAQDMAQNMAQNYRKARNKSRRVILALALFALLAFVASLCIGQYAIAPRQLWQALAARLWGAEAPAAEVQTVLFNVRLPRLLAALLVGAALSAAGAAFQGLFRNPMVSPDLLGAASGAGFGAALAIFLAGGMLAVSASAFAFGLLAVAVAYAISTRTRRNKTMGMVLTGIMISSLFSSATSYIKLIADTEKTLPAITYWLMGSLASIGWADVRFVALPIVAGLAALLLLGWRLNLVMAGEDEARSMGVHLGRVRLATVVAATLVTAAAVSVSGLIGWVGLVVPHICRMLVGSDHRVLLPASMLMGGGFLLLVDDIARSAVASEIPIGILTAFVGAPFFLYLFLGRKEPL